MEGAKAIASGAPFLHIFPGVLILLLALWRLAVRVSSPQAPQPPGWAFWPVRFIGRFTR